MFCHIHYTEEGFQRVEVFCCTNMAWFGFRCSPVKKSADDANGHQQLQHEGQVDFPDEPCRGKGGVRKVSLPWPEPLFFFLLPAHLSGRPRRRSLRGRRRRCPASIQVERRRTTGDQRLLRNEPGRRWRRGPGGRQRRCSQARPDPPASTFM